MDRTIDSKLFGCRGEWEVDHWALDEVKFTWIHNGKWDR